MKAVEQEVFGFDHAELGADAAVSWNLPGAVCHMIRHHHQPTQATSGIAMAHVINTADMFVNLSVAGENLDELFRAEKVVTFKIRRKQFEKIWDRISVRLDEMTAVLS